ncbi:MAG: helix-turn-helix transcriptional regulator [Kordia sp.]|uniref:helix-turn-helix transcriptional regulator n=1 Tax=Kordia sp. TaxID=1965332 RepID=UPI00385FDE9D
MMTTHENILIGSDTSVSLASILKSLQTMNQYSFITATRVSDIVQLSKSIQPAFIILSFRDNQNVINSLLSYNRDFSIPMLCLQTKSQYRELQIRENLVVFTQSFEYGMQSNNLVTNMLGILKLIKKTETVSSSKIMVPKGKYPEDQSKDLTRYTLELDQKKAVLDKIKERIKQLYTDVDAATKTQLMSIVNTIKMARNDRKHWDDFKHYFENINPNFLKQLSATFPCLTAKDLKYCCYLKMNMSNEDIRLILGINQESVRTHKYRLKKKMVLEKHQDLHNYLQTFAS